MVTRNVIEIYVYNKSAEPMEIPLWPADTLSTINRKSRSVKSEHKKYKLLMK